jgi:hypothetical protein
MKVNKHAYFSKKFQGFGFIIDFDVPQAINYTYCVIKIKLIFFGAWIVLKDK